MRKSTKKALGLPVSDSCKHLAWLWNQRTKADYVEGLLAYERYNQVMRWFGEYYNYPVADVCSVFVATSPNNDYHGNLRSTASILHGHRNGVPCERITVTTFNSCRDRAYSYLEGVSFEDTVRGPKIKAFRDNILNPQSSQLVTVDGHMIASYLGKRNMTMKGAAEWMSKGHKQKYELISRDIRNLAAGQSILPLQMQAILWHTRKTLYGIKSSSNLDLFKESDSHATLCRPEHFLPYPTKAPEAVCWLDELTQLELGV